MEPRYAVIPLSPSERADPAGTYRLVQNFEANSVTRETVYTPPPPAEVPALMQELVAWMRHDSEVHPVLNAGIAQFQLVHVHPFLDGNGRMSSETPTRAITSENTFAPCCPAVPELRELLVNAFDSPNPWARAVTFDLIAPPTVGRQPCDE